MPSFLACFAKKKKKKKERGEIDEQKEKKGEIDEQKETNMEMKIKSKKKKKTCWRRTNEFPMGPGSFHTFAEKPANLEPSSTTEYVILCQPSSEEICGNFFSEVRVDRSSHIQKLLKRHDWSEKSVRMTPRLLSLQGGEPVTAYCYAYCGITDHEYLVRCLRFLNETLSEMEKNWGTGGEEIPRFIHYENLCDRYRGIWSPPGAFPLYDYSIPKCRKPNCTASWCQRPMTLDYIDI